MIPGCPHWADSNGSQLAVPVAHRAAVGAQVQILDTWRPAAKNCLESNGACNVQVLPLAGEKSVTPTNEIGQTDLRVKQAHFRTKPMRPVDARFAGEIGMRLLDKPPVHC